MARKARFAGRIKTYLSSVPSLTKYMIVSMTAIAVYAGVVFWLRVQYGIWIDTEFSKLWYAYWGSEIFICSGLRTGKWIIMRKNPFTGEGGTSGTYTSGSDSDDAVG